MKFALTRSAPASILAIAIINSGTWFFHPERAIASEFQMSVHTIDEVADGAMPVIGNISATEATIIFQSNIPLACSVVFGETKNFGRIAVDDDMDGGAHSNHHPVLAVLTPETEYFYRVQGVASDGKVFVGEVQSFRTLALPTGSQTDLATIAAGARVLTVSSNYGGVENHQSWGADGAIDGGRQKAWSSAGDGNDAFIEIELQEAIHIGEVSVWTRSMSDGSARILTFEITIDGGNTIGPFELPDANQPYHFQIDTNAQRLRLDVLESTGGNVGLVEFSAFGK